MKAFEVYRILGNNIKSIRYYVNRYIRNGMKVHKNLCEGNGIYVRQICSEQEGC